MSGIVWICICAVWMWDFLWAAVSVTLALPIAVKHTMNYLEHDWEDSNIISYACTYFYGTLAFILHSNCFSQMWEIISCCMHGKHSQSSTKL